MYGESYEDYGKEVERVRLEADYKAYCAQIADFANHLDNLDSTDHPITIKCNGMSVVIAGCDENIEALKNLIKANIESI